MKADCRAHAAKALGVTDYEYGIEVKYEGQRVDKTHAVNGSAVVRGQTRTFQCSFAPDGRTIARFVVNAPDETPRPAAQTSGASVPAAPEDGGPRSWEVTGVSRGLDLREKPSTSARALTRYASGTVLHNLGCRRVQGRIWCDVQELRGGPRGYVPAEFLKPAISPDGSVAMGPDDSALRAGQGKFDATGPLPCAQYAGQPMGQCEFGVARAGGGYATVVVKKPDGRTRAIFFMMGKPIGADTSQADDPGKFSAKREGDLNFIRIGNERYEIPDAVVLGG